MPTISPTPSPLNHIEDDKIADLSSQAAHTSIAVRPQSPDGGSVNSEAQPALRVQEKLPAPDSPDQQTVHEIVNDENSGIAIIKDCKHDSEVSTPESVAIATSDTTSDSCHHHSLPEKQPIESLQSSVSDQSEPSIDSALNQVHSSTSACDVITTPSNSDLGKASPEACYTTLNPGSSAHTCGTVSAAGDIAEPAEAECMTRGLEDTGAHPPNEVEGEAQCRMDCAADSTTTKESAVTNDPAPADIVGDSRLLENHIEEATNSDCVDGEHVTQTTVNLIETGDVVSPLVRGNDRQPIPQHLSASAVSNYEDVEEASSAIPAAVDPLLPATHPSNGLQGSDEPLSFTADDNSPHSSTAAYTSSKSSVTTNSFVTTASSSDAAAVDTVSPDHAAPVHADVTGTAHRESVSVDPVAMDTVAKEQDHPHAANIDQDSRDTSITESRVIANMATSNIATADPSSSNALIVNPSNSKVAADLTAADLISADDSTADTHTADGSTANTHIAGGSTANTHIADGSTVDTHTTDGSIASAHTVGNSTVSTNTADNDVTTDDTVGNIIAADDDVVGVSAAHINADANAADENLAEINSEDISTGDENLTDASMSDDDLADISATDNDAAVVSTVDANNSVDVSADDDALDVRINDTDNIKPASSLPITMTKAPFTVEPPTAKTLESDGLSQQHTTEQRGENSISHSDSPCQDHSEAVTCDSKRFGVDATAAHGCGGMEVVEDSVGSPDIGRARDSPDHTADICNGIEDSGSSLEEPNSNSILYYSKVYKSKASRSSTLSTPNQSASTDGDHSMSGHVERLVSDHSTGPSTAKSDVVTRFGSHADDLPPDRTATCDVVADNGVVTSRKGEGQTGDVQSNASCVNGAVGSPTDMEDSSCSDGLADSTNSYHFSNGPNNDAHNVSLIP